MIYFRTLLTNMCEENVLWDIFIIIITSLLLLYILNSVCGIVL